MFKLMAILQNTLLTLKFITMAEQATSSVQGPESKRPGFLTVLCVLTFIGSSLGILFSLFGAIGVGALEGMASRFAGASVQSSGSGMLIAMALFSALCLTGAIFMWNLKKMGFFLYVIAQALIVVFGWSIMTFVFALLFVILYALNFKALR